MKAIGAAVTILVLAVTALSACGTPPDGDSGGGGLRVVATTTQVGSIARAIGGDAVEVTVLVPPGVEAHDFELTPAAGAALERADVILVSGAGLEDWLDAAIETIGDASRIRDLSDGIELRRSTAGDLDPHYWLSGPNAVRMVENARDALSEAAPAEADGFAGRADALVAEIHAADAEARRLIDAIPAGRRQVVTDHDAIGYFLDEYGLELVGSIYPALDVASEPSARDIELLVDAIREDGPVVIFVESAANPRLARAVAEETGSTLIETPLYTDSLGPEGSGADSLPGMLLYDARVIAEGLSGG